MSIKKLPSSQIVELQRQIESALEYVYENYSGLCDPTSEHASESPCISYHEGCNQLFLHELYGATGDTELVWFSNTDNLPDLDDERDIICALPTAECPECNTIQFGDDIDSCSQCSHKFN
jgi:hypothetical protein